MRTYVILLTFLTLSLVFLTPGQAEVTAIKAGRILTISNEPITDGIILIEDGKISDIGTEIEIPGDAEVIDTGKSIVMPGMIDIHSHLGLHWESEPVRMNPDSPTSGSGRVNLVSISDAIKPHDKAFRDILRSGVTSVLLAP